MIPLPVVSYDEVALFKLFIDVTKLAVDCEAVNAFKLFMDITKLPVEILDVYSLNEEVNNFSPNEVISVS